MQWVLKLLDSSVVLVVNGEEKGVVKDVKAVKDSLVFLKVRILAMTMSMIG